MKIMNIKKNPGFPGLPIYLYHLVKGPNQQMNSLFQIHQQIQAYL